jgi:predicted glycogen debranching enzyme
MRKSAPGEYSVDLRLDETGIFEGKAFFSPEGSSNALWPDGGNLRVKVVSGLVRGNNSVYTVFPRQFGSFRSVAKELDFIMKRMGFKIVQTLPPFPVPVTYAVMGEYGCPFASTDFLSVDPAMAEFDAKSTPLDQFRELAGEVHARDGLFFIDLPANHTGWGSVLQTHHPEWFKRNSDGAFRSPGAWGVVWEDLVELDYSNDALVEYMAGVFLFWCGNGVDGFRCDAGYMIPQKAWETIVARVRAEFPDTVFMLEGLGGDLSVTDALLSRAGLDWAYSEIFQIYDRSQFEWYLPQAVKRSRTFGTLINFAETHDNDRLARFGEVYARLRVSLAALLSLQGAWGIANGVEWLATEKIDVHGKNDLNWGAGSNIVDLISRLNFILSAYKSFHGDERLEIITRGEGNTLAVLRGEEILVLANLDCNASTRIDFDRSRFPHEKAFDLLSERMTDLPREMSLAPGQVLCLAAKTPSRAEDSLPEREKSLFVWRYPQDIDRTVVVPGGETLDIHAPSRFSLRLVTLGGVTVFRAYSRPHVKLSVRIPEYAAEGISCERYKLHFELYLPEGVKRAVSELLVPPPSDRAYVRPFLQGDEISKRRSCRAVLSNSISASSQVRALWGEIRSQYDSFLSANPQIRCPSDRIVLWTRARAWLQYAGFSHDFDESSQTAFEADPAGRFARWSFSVPCAFGRKADFTFTLSLAENANAARLIVRRTDDPKEEGDFRVRLVIRPDIEWRSFHSTTKAYEGSEDLFRNSISHTENSFVFSPYGEELFFSAGTGRFHFEPQWVYNVPHSEEAERGQAPAGDIFSPGWISVELSPGEKTVLECSYGKERPRFAAVQRFKGKKLLPLEVALREAMKLFIVERAGLKTVIAGFPWFLDWGRDTFIFMRGMIAAGMVRQALEILSAFARFEENGTLPNIIYGETAGNRDTVDAQLWFVRCVSELAAAGAYGKDVSRLKVVCRRIIENYVKGTPNGIKVDPGSFLVSSPSHFTWMDTNYPACTPRNGYPVEIQALWISALKFLGMDEKAALALDSVKRLMRLDDGGYGDCIDAPNGESAARGVLDKSIRPNQLFLVTLGVLEDKSIVEKTQKLLVPGSIRSLDCADEKYRSRYEGDEDSSRKPAYHNGTAWAWVMPSFVEAAYMTGLLSKESALSLISQSVDLLNDGCLGHIPEISDADAPHAQKGCSAQAWSVSELLRVLLSLQKR